MNTPNQRGSIYALTMLTVAAVTSMVLIGVAVRSSISTQSNYTRQINTNSAGATSAAELALARVMADEEWKTSAQTGAVFRDVKVGDSSYTCTVVDASTSKTPTDDTSTYRLIVESENGVSSLSSQFDLNVLQVDYINDVLSVLGAEAYWPMNEVTRSSVATDPIGNRNGTYLDPYVAGVSTGEEIGVVPLFANADDHIETPYDVAYEHDVEGTISFWVKLTGTSRVTTYGLLGQRYETDGWPGATLICTTGSLSFSMSPNGQSAMMVTAQTTYDVIQVGVWHHVAVVWAAKGNAVYVDGRVAATNTGVCTWTAWDHKRFGDQPLVIGAGYIPADASQPLVGFDGSIAHFAIMESALDAETIAAMAQITPEFSQTTLPTNTWARVIQE